MTNGEKGKQSMQNNRNFRVSHVFYCHNNGETNSSRVLHKPGTKVPNRKDTNILGQLTLLAFRMRSSSWHLTNRRERDILINCFSLVRSIRSCLVHIGSIWKRDTTAKKLAQISCITRPVTVRFSKLSNHNNLLMQRRLPVSTVYRDNTQTKINHHFSKQLAYLYVTIMK